jgi:hypothetical protein
MSAFDTHLRDWWAALSDTQRARLRAAVDADKLEPATVKLLAESRCPVGPIGTKWEAQPEFGWSWPLVVREFVRAQE